MILSICIPIYNTDLTDLVTDLSAEIELRNLNETVEIILIDDESNEEYKIINQKLIHKANYIELPNNIGRSKIRNKFLDFAKGEFILFLDGDSLISSELKNSFIGNYLIELKSDTHCICGGRIYPILESDYGISLNYRYGVQKESKSAIDRQKNPSFSFMSNNFLIRKSIFESIKFDENLTQYGHEDTIFGVELHQKKITIDHIENPVLNGYIETNDVFLRKSEQAIENLALIYSNYPNPAELRSHVQLLRIADLITKYKLKPVYLFIFNRLESKWKKQLLSDDFSLNTFNFYKLGLFLRLAK